jgi:hypothetical protein
MYPPICTLVVMEKQAAQDVPKDRSVGALAVGPVKRWSKRRGRLMSATMT